MKAVSFLSPTPFEAQCLAFLACALLKPAGIGFQSQMHAAF